jgi:molybdopterin-guanine dinucleotide biosynthesis protein A
MGRDKSRLAFGGQSLVRRIQNMARSLDHPVRLICKDCIPGLGPMGGVHTAIQSGQTESILFLACDMPFIDASLLTAMKRKFLPKETGVFCAPTGGRPGFPFLVRRSVASMVERLIRENKLSLKELQVSIKARLHELPPRNALALFNINTRDDYERALILSNRMARPTHPGSPPRASRRTGSTAGTRQTRPR